MFQDVPLSLQTLPALRKQNMQTCWCLTKERSAQTGPDPIYVGTSWGGPGGSSFVHPPWEHLQAPPKLPRALDIEWNHQHQLINSRKSKKDASPGHKKMCVLDQILDGKPGHLYLEHLSGGAVSKWVQATRCKVRYWSASSAFWQELKRFPTVPNLIKWVFFVWPNLGSRAMPFNFRPVTSRCLSPENSKVHWRIQSTDFGFCSQSESLKNFNSFTNIHHYQTRCLNKTEHWSNEKPPSHPSKSKLFTWSDEIRTWSTQEKDLRSSMKWFWWIPPDNQIIIRCNLNKGDFASEHCFVPLKH